MTRSSLNHYEHMWARTEAGLASLRRVKCAPAPAHVGQVHSGTPVLCVDVVTSLLTCRAFGLGIFPGFRCARATPRHAAPRRRAVILLPWLPVATNFGGLSRRCASNARLTRPHQSFGTLQDSLPGFPCMRPDHRSFAFRGGPLRGEQPTMEGVVNVRFQGGEVRSA